MVGWRKHDHYIVSKNVPVDENWKERQEVKIVAKDPTSQNIEEEVALHVQSRYPSTKESFKIFEHKDTPTRSYSNSDILPSITTKT